MPELPEVETIVGDLKKKIIGRRITGLWFDVPKIMKNKVRRPAAGIKGLKIIGVSRRGKNILIKLEKEIMILIHQKLTGHLLLGRWQIAGGRAIPLAKGRLQEKVNDYIHLIFYLDNGLDLGLSDLRKFAKVIIGNREEIENLPELKKLGPELLNRKFTFEKFKKLIRPQKRNVKKVLLDQEVIAGIGNIYSDEILWQAKINPMKPANRLSDSELKEIYKAAKIILQKAVRLRGASISDFRDTAGRSGRYAETRLAYQRENEPCRRCRTPIKRIKIAGRSAHFCPRCQKL